MSRRAIALGLSIAAWMLSGCSKSAPPEPPGYCGTVMCPTDPNGTYACVADQLCALSCNPPYVVSSDGGPCVSPDTPEQCGASLALCPADPTGVGSPVCLSGACSVTCPGPYLTSPDGTSCVSPNSPTACGPNVVACPTDPNGAAVCTDGACSLDCNQPYVLASSGDSCESPNTPAACGPTLTVCADASNGIATCGSSGVCGLTCESPYELGADGGSCVSPDIPDACGPEAQPCPGDPHGVATCSAGGVCGLACQSPFVASMDAGTCVSPEAIQGCGPDATPCPTDPNGTAACDSEACSLTCNAAFALTATGTGCYSTCFSILTAGLSMGNGVYAIVNPDGGTTSAWCDMTTEGGGWMLVTPDMATTSGAVVKTTVSSDVDGGVIVQSGSTLSGCDPVSLDSVMVAEAAPWTQIRYHQTFTGHTSCYSIFGSGADYGSSGVTPPNLAAFESPPDETLNAVLMSPTTDAFDGTASTCTTPDFWSVNNTSTRSVDVIQRRLDPAQPAGPGTEISCTGVDALPAWTYSAITVRDCPMTPAACGPGCDACPPGPAHSAPTCTSGACAWSCDASYVVSADGSSCVP